MKKFAMLSLVMTSAAMAQTVQIENGKLHGGLADGVQFYKGIPYAEPPVGSLRWQPPQKAKNWQGIKDATKYGAQCPQNTDLGSFGKAGGSEDCLFINVFAPKDAKAHDHLPVLFWIHGGAWLVGASDDYNPSELAKKAHAVVVTLNYRLGVLGFFSHSSLDNEGHAFGNYGYMDQSLALDWVQKNIAQFGGNPKNITIFGESSGGNAVLAQVVSPWSKNKFQHAISMSGGISMLREPVFFAPFSLQRARAMNQKFVDAVGCQKDTANCLRQLPLHKILSEQNMGNALQQGMIDGSFLQEHPADAIKNGRFNRVTLVNGITRNEGRFFAGLMENLTGNPMTKANYQAALEQTLGKALTQKVMQQFPPEKYDSIAEAYADVFTSAFFACVANQANHWASRYTPTYGYVFADRTAPSYLMPATFPIGAGHTYELPYLFRGFHGGSGLKTTLNPLQDKLSEEMMQLWTALANPENSKWQKFDAQKENYLLLKLPAAEMREQALSQHHCDFWDKTGIY
ncbi:carboxylesterase family protein [Avibacterium sp. 20-15]|uniref:carboxylesterase/lipase family protein n=1 Tax=unclassified Avibacterium TaxID=2685287 RepID=UPI002027052C|nr:MULTISPECIES: carboxylesterase family protein [unclassified Avibacterium]MCW9731990.1 carboxylesterase family protein [Avibacterium sp. 20-15]URL04173.1 carboxylesterase family protein [Avibacterium sp. 20-132]